MKITFFNNSLDLPQVVYYDESIAVLYKPSFMHTLTIGSSNYSLEYFWRQQKICNNHLPESGFVQRLDYLTAGLLLVAISEVSYQYIKNNKNIIKKEYFAKCENILPYFAPQGYELKKWQQILANPINKLLNVHVKARFVYRDNKRNAVRLLSAESKSKYATQQIYQTDFQLTRCGQLWQVKATLLQGYRHQVRATISALGLVVQGDALYGAQTQENEGIHFWATTLSFDHPLTKKKYHIKWKNFLL